ncbi:LCP family protein [Actinoallomurus soli]|uniref:LCP family protein n=1 Tax=Actinoallomurus soli TaxID=2952535 RepID=UPI002093DDB2|nr:LCP family protein [Actinoallomurus soli]MCO5972877.1 LCP family protein [Actinoallomurus soli]
MAPGQTRGHRSVPVGGLWRALGLTLASAVVWGTAHVAAGRRAAGFALMGLLVLLVGGAATAGELFQDQLKQLVVQNTWLNVIIAVLLALAVVWAAVVIRSYQVVRPVGLPAAMRVASTTLVVVLSLLICTPFVYAANTTYVLRDTLSKIFPGGDKSGPKVNAANPWKNLPRLNVLLLGGDGGKDRTGIRTDSMTVASIDTKTGNTVMLSIPRGLYGFDMPPQLQSRFPNGYTGEVGCGVVGRDCGLLNELYLYGEKHPELEPGYEKGQRGPHLLEDVIGYLTGLKIHYYVLVNLSGFKDIVNAMGGVTVHIEKRLPIGGEPERGIPPSGYLQPGTHHLNGEQALWYGRSRHADDDFHRMDRQKCLLKDIAEQADPQKVVTHFEKLAEAATNTIYTNIPSALLPALVKLSGTVKHGADITSLTYNPDKIPGFHTDRRADATIIQVMRRTAANAIADSENPHKPSASPTVKRHKKKTPTTSPTAGATASNGSVSLKNVCG